jgi:translocation and assembly module TamB
LKLRAALRVAGLTVMAVLVMACVSAGSLWIFAQTQLGGEIIRRIALPKVDARIAGRLAVDRLRFGGDRLILDGVVLRDPDGAVVARVARIDLQLSLWALLRRHVDVRRLELQRPELALVTGPSNLARALAPRQSRAPPPAGVESQARSGVVVDLRALAVTGGTLTIRSSAREIHLGGIDVDGSARYEGRAAFLRVDLEADTEAGRLGAHGALDLARLQAAPAGFVLRVRDLDLAELMRDLPASLIALDVQAHGKGLSADLDARVAGGAARGHVALADGRLEARLGIEATDLGATARSLARSQLAPPIALAGRGRIDVALDGPWTRPSLRVAARIPALTVARNSARELTISGRLPRLDAPTALDLDLRAALVRIGGHELHGVGATVRASGAALAASIHTAAPYPIAVEASGRRLSPRALEIARLTLRYPEESWTIARPARIAVSGARVSVAGLDLRARDQIIRVDLEKSARGGRARVQISRLDLAHLPRPLVPPALASAGMLDLDLDLEATSTRLRGRLATRGLGTGLDATFDLPSAWPPANARAPLELKLTSQETDLAGAAKTIAALSGKPIPVDARGKVRLAATLDGSASKPRLDLRFEGHALEIGGHPLGDLALTIRGDGAAPLALQLTASRGGAPPATLNASTPLSLAAIVRHRPGAAGLKRTPFNVDGHVAGVPLALLGKATGAPWFRGGTLSAKLEAHGSALAPTGTLAIDLQGATATRIPPTDARIELSADRHVTQADVRVLRLGHPLLALEARLDASPAALRNRTALAEAPVHVRAVIGPLTMRRRGLPAVFTDEARESALQGTLHADLSIDGTLAAPRLVAHAQTGPLALDRTPVGYARLELRYGERQAHVDLDAHSANGGTLTLGAGARVDLGLAAILGGKLDPAHWSYELQLAAQHLDLRGLSGLTPGLRNAAGLLDAQVTASGSIGDPRFSGRVQCKGCELQLSGLGDFRDIHLALHGETDKIVLDELSAKSGDGDGRLTATLSRHPGADAYQLAGSVQAKEIPVYQEGQPLARLSLDAALSGSSGGRGSEADVSVEIREAHVKLSDEKRRQLQRLETPDDVVIVADGRPIDRAQAQKLRALAERLAPASVPAKSTPAGAAPGGTHGIWSGIKLEVNAPRQLWVNGGGAQLELGLAPGFRIAVRDETRINGEVIVRRGRIDALGRRFDLKADSTLQFDGEPGRPTLDATAQYQNNDENVTVLVTAKGPLDHLAITVSSPNRPELNDSQLYALIITGHLQTSSGGGSGGSVGSAASNEATSLVAGVIAGQLQKTLARHLPLDVLTIDAGNGQGLSGTQLEAGRYVTERLYVGYIGRIGADPTRYQNKNAVHLEYQLTARWQIAGEYGDVGTGSADLMWKRSY